MQFQEGRHEIRLIDHDNEVYTRKMWYSLNLPSTFPAHRTNRSPQKQTCRKVVTLLLCVPDKGRIRSLALQCIHAKALHNTLGQSTKAVPCTIHVPGISPFWLWQQKWRPASIQLNQQYNTSNIRSTRWRNWLRLCVTSPNVEGSIPDGISGIFHWPNPSGRAMARGRISP